MTSFERILGDGVTAFFPGNWYCSTVMYCLLSILVTSSIPVLVGDHKKTCEPGSDLSEVLQQVDGLEVWHQTTTIGYHWYFSLYPLVNIQKAMERSTHF